MSHRRRQPKHGLLGSRRTAKRWDGNFGITRRNLWKAHSAPLTEPALTLRRRSPAMPDQPVDLDKLDYAGAHAKCEAYPALAAELRALRKDQGDWRKGVALIAAALGEKNSPNLCCV